MCGRSRAREGIPHCPGPLCSGSSRAAAGFIVGPETHWGCPRPSPLICSGTMNATAAYPGTSRLLHRCGPSTTFPASSAQMHKGQAGHSGQCLLGALGREGGSGRQDAGSAAAPAPLPSLPSAGTSRGGTMRVHEPWPSSRNSFTFLCSHVRRKGR